MVINVGDIWCTVANPRDHLVALATIKQVCRARPNGYNFMPRYKSGRWDGYISLMSGFNKFPTGLLSYVTQVLQDKKIKFTLEYLPRSPIIVNDATADMLKGVTLRDYQVDAINTLIRSVRGVAKMATNSGKTEVMAGVAKSLGVPRTVVLLHRKELLYQTAERFSKRLGMPIGMIGDGIWDKQQITVAMIQTLNNATELPVHFYGNALLMVDECHNASSDTFMSVMDSIPGSFRFGFSGTPLKNDVLPDMKLISATGPVVVDVNNKFLIDEEYSARPIVYIEDMLTEHGEEFYDNDYMTAYDRLIVNSKKRNSRILNIARKAVKDGPVLILVNRVEHGKNLSKRSDVVFVSGSDTTERRKEILDKMSEGGIYCATPIFDEGVDVPSISTLILAGGGKSQVKLLQRIGRGLRKKEGANVLSIYDFNDLSNKHLNNHSADRYGTYEDEGFEIISV